MKKTYIIPKAETYDIKSASLLANSGVGTTYEIETENPIEGDAGEAATREVKIWDNLWMLVLVLLFSITANAQTYTTVEPADAPVDGKTHGMILYLKNNTQVTYALTDLQHVTYLPGVGMKVYLKNATTSIDYLYQQIDRIDYAQDGNENSNWKAFGWTDYPEAWRLEYPHLHENVSPTADAERSQIIVKRTDDYGITFSLEWDNSLVANRWTCYQLHAGNTLTGADRNDDFKADPEVAVSPVLDDYRNSGFSRGHLCPSADRQCSVEQNKQTFYLTNMQPQYQSHNGGLWSRLETLVRDFATNDEYTALHCDTLYIVKAATITDKVTINDQEVDGIYADRCVGNASHKHELIVPKYFYMALLHYNKETDTYHSIAFWTDHIDETQSVKNLADYAISIKELEKRTGIDFFCNLPDVIEEDVEAQEPDLEFWKKITRSGE
ncbi:MAG: DNA/RNA non-specific endonuclease [Bacteroidaceae bacterium]|nr:DNA/RNA non-specific endonuclease [Bacteroidaceae bacterium]